MDSITQSPLRRDSDSFQSHSSRDSAAGELRRLTQRAGSGDHGALADFRRDYEPHVRRIVRRVLRGAAPRRSPMDQRIGREIRLTLREHASKVAREPSRLVELVVQRVCRLLLEQDRVRGASQHLKETVCF